MAKRTIQNFVFYYPIHVVATNLKEAKQELKLDLDCDPRMVFARDVSDGYIKFLKTTKASKDDKEYFLEKEQEIQEMNKK